MNGKTKQPPSAQLVTLSVNQIRRTSAQVPPLTRAHKRRLLRRLDLRLSELDPIGRGHLDVYCRAAAKIDLADAWFEQHGYIGDDGALPAVAAHYSTLLNTAGRALERLAVHLRERPPEDPFARYRVVDAEER